MTTILKDENFDKEIKDSKTPVLVDFFAEWCEPCKILAPILEEVEKDMAGKIKLVKVNIEQAPIVSQKFQVERIPTVILFKDNNPVGGFIGMSGKEDIIKWLNETIK